MNSAKPKVLLIEDSADLQQAMLDYFSADYSITSVNEAEAAIRLINEEHYDLVILDLGLPRMDGHKLCAHIRSQEKTKETPIIIVSGRADVSDKLLSFSIGANDFLSKPADFRELKARIQIQLNIAAAKKSDSYTRGPFLIDTSKNEISVNNSKGKTTLNLSPQEFKLCCFLADRLEVVITRSQLMTEIWGANRIVSTRSVDVTICKLRKKMLEHGIHLHTIRGLGYKLSVLDNRSEKAG